MTRRGTCPGLAGRLCRTRPLRVTRKRREPVIDTARLESVASELRALGVPDAEIAHQVDVLAKDSERQADDGGRGAAIANWLLVNGRSSNE
jgi:hypothetical protein